LEVAVCREGLPGVMGTLEEEADPEAIMVDLEAVHESVRRLQRYVHSLVRTAARWAPRQVAPILQRTRTANSCRY